MVFNLLNYGNVPTDIFFSNFILLSKSSKYTKIRNSRKKSDLHPQAVPITYKVGGGGWLNELGIFNEMMMGSALY
jgi:hypothetical protein